MVMAYKFHTASNPNRPKNSDQTRSREQTSKLIKINFELILLYIGLLSPDATILKCISQSAIEQNYQEDQAFSTAHKRLP
jgi:hypothetical protein